MSNRAAFTFTEILLATSLMVLAVVPLVGFVADLTRQTGSTRSRAVTRALARGVTERLRLERLGELASRLPSFEAGARWIDADPLLRLPDGPLADLVRTLKIRRYAIVEPNAGTPAAARTGVLRVRVDWTEDGRLTSYVATTLIVDSEMPTGAP